MPSVKTRKSYRFSEETLTRVAELAARWSDAAPLSETAVIEEAVRRACDAPKPTGKKRGQPLPR